MSDHHLSETGLTVVCTAPPSAYCRRQPSCDAEYWNEDGCVEHFGEHKVADSAECWQAHWLHGTHLSETFGDWDATPDLIPLAPIDIDFIGVDEGCSWDWAKEA